MKKKQLWALGVAVGLATAAAMSMVVEAQQPSEPMSFFVTSVGLGDGANLGGLAGADGHCQTLAAAAGRGNSTWRAYLSTQGSNAVNARDRIGNGPWYAHNGRPMAADQGWLHGDTIEQARLALIEGVWPDLGVLGLYSVVASVIAVSGYVTFSKLSRGFADVL